MRSLRAPPKYVFYGNANYVLGEAVMFYFDAFIF